MGRGYQHDFSSMGTAMHDVAARERKARTMAAVLDEFLDGGLNVQQVLSIGASTGIIDSYLAERSSRVTGIDIDVPAIRHAALEFRKDNLDFCLGDALHLPFREQSFDVVICTQVYEHVPNPYIMMDEIFRVLRKGGVCYFAATSRFVWRERHYHLPLLSVVPRPLAHLYMRLAGKGRFYYERHFSYWGLRRLVRKFKLHDYTARIVASPEAYGVDYLVGGRGLKSVLARLVSQYMIWLSPGYIWLLEKKG